MQLKKLKYLGTRNKHCISEYYWNCHITAQSLYWLENGRSILVWVHNFENGLSIHKHNDHLFVNVRWLYHSFI